MSGSTTNFVKLENLQLGIERFQRRWPMEADFHNAFYQRLLEATYAGITTNLWANLVDTLALWKAIRPRSKADIWTRGCQRLPDLQRERTTILDRHSGHTLDLSVATWGEVEALFTVAMWIKDVASPVFASKLCHFLLSDTFPVADRAMIGIHATTYQAYWLRCQDGWVRCEQKDILKRELQQVMSTVAIANYPWSAKITELCAMGAYTE
jgi:hypothetical protein